MAKHHKKSAKPPHSGEDGFWIVLVILGLSLAATTTGVVLASFN